ncbi:Suppressor of fused protein (SUFU) [Thalassoglobus neptunius]|uniref:Suppressor of fused protein (SUFU) n=1 Tax=Thalassoglobus neptunius TaxID=1938619 RepID=A0A5C5WNN8_9PLAN|nr:suppressor of fused domain protein [Thalassoglobus neptunius]TWT52217.1 Suppressor of fused protein (SUFU) [Thalassoglobus neptunius]
MSDDSSEEFEDGDPIGWSAIDDSVKAIYGDLEPMHWGTVIPYSLGGPDPLTGVSAYPSRSQQPHFHYVTYGFSDLYEKEGDDPEWSGYGFELSFRLASHTHAEAPIWVVSLLQNLARYVFDTGRGFGVGHTMPLNSPICRESETAIRSITFVRDPELGLIDTPNGQVEFLQVVGLTDDELDATQSWNAEHFTELMTRQKNPLLLTDLKRSSYLEDPEFADQVEERTRTEGASAGIMTADQFRVIGHPSAGTFALTIGALLAPGLGQRLRGRIPFQRNFSVFGEAGELRFVPADHFSIEVEEGLTSVRLKPSQAESLVSALTAKAGTFTFPDMSGLTLIIEPTEITDADGNITDVIG